MLNRFYRSTGKRLFDLSLAIPAIVLLSPLIALTALAVRIGLGRDVLYRQQRCGLGGRPFTLYKFRTMLEARDPAGQLLPDGERLTRLGAMVRKWSLDELPQFWNVLRGDMSLVGPRPLLLHYITRYTPEQFRRHEVPPGVTGWTQINGRNANTWDEKFRLDVWYVDHQSLWLDVKILLRTLWAVIRRQNINARDHATMPEFQGTLDARPEVRPPDSHTRCATAAAAKAVFFSGNSPEYTEG